MPPTGNGVFAIEKAKGKNHITKHKQEIYALAYTLTAAG